MLKAGGERRTAAAAAVANARALLLAQVTSVYIGERLTAAFESHVECEQPPFAAALIARAHDALATYS